MLRLSLSKYIQEWDIDYSIRPPTYFLVIMRIILTFIAEERPQFCKYQTHFYTEFIDSNGDDSFIVLFWFTVSQYDNLSLKDSLHTN